MAAVTICSDFGGPPNKFCHCFHCFPTYLPCSDGTRCHALHFLKVDFQASFFTLLFTFMKRLFRSSFLPTITSQSNHTSTTALSNSMKLSHAHGATQDRRVMVERSDRMWSTGEGNGKPLQYSCLENLLKSMKRQNDRIPKEELPRLVGAQYATGDQWRNNSRKNKGMEPE